jgi:potassium efflux system protein
VTRFLLSLFVFVALPFWVWAQETTKMFDADAFEKLAVRAEEVIDKQGASSTAFEELRLQLAQYRTLAANQKALAATKVTPIFERLQALGPMPADGETEANDVAQLRFELDKSLKNARGPVAAAEESYKRADGLIKRIDTLVRDRTTKELLEKGDSPLSPVLIFEAIDALRSYGKNLLSEIEKNLASETRHAERIGNILLVAILLCMALLLLVRSRRWSRQVQDLFSRNASSSTAALFGFIGSLSQLILPAVGLVVLVQGLLLLDLFELRGYFLLRSLGIAGFSLYFATWLARSMFVPTSSQPALIEIDEPHQRSMRRSFLALGLMFALREMLNAMIAGSSNSPSIISAMATLTFPLIVVGGIALFRIGRVFGQAARVAANAEGGNAFLGRISSLLGNFCVGAACAGPVLAAVGYNVAGNLLVFSTASSLLLVTGLYIVFRLIGSLSGHSTEVVVAAGAEDDSRRYSALFRVAVGFIMICISLPFLALIWGARVSDLQEIWLLARNGISLGDTRVSLTDFLTFILIFSIGYTVTRVLQSALRTTVLPNTRIDVGGQNAIVTGTGYVGIFLAAVAAISATGIDLSNLAIVAGALSVGIGFGLQAIVSNFVSGIILLIERPIKAGDWIEVGTYSGYVRKISVRSTEIETFDRASVVIPNADLISGTVTNWTHSSMAGRVRVPVGVSYNSDPRHVEDVLREVAEAHPMVLFDPAPVIMFMGFGADSMDFEIRAILRDVNWMLSAKSDMNFEIARRFREEGIEIPFAQRDVYIKNLDQLGLKPAETVPKAEVAKDE